MTPRMISVFVDAASERVRREHELAAWTAWHTAVLGRTKKVPRLEQMMPKQKPKAQSVREMITAAKLIDERVNAKAKR